MWIYTFIIACSAIIIMLPNAPLVFLMVLSAVVNGVLLPFVLVYAISLVNNKKIMGEYVNSTSYNYISWGTIIIIICLTTMFIVTTVIPFQS